MTTRIIHYTAAGGVVVDGGRVLVLIRPSRGEVRLPKGHVDPGETAEAAAVREVAEESGYAARVVADLGSQTVEFDFEGRHVVRAERYFLMNLAEEAVRRPPAETGRAVAPTEDARDRTRTGESQFQPKWLGWDEALSQLTFEAEREWVRRARRAAGA